MTNQLPITFCMAIENIQNRIKELLELAGGLADDHEIRSELEIFGPQGSDVKFVYQGDGQWYTSNLC